MRWYMAPQCEKCTGVAGGGCGIIPCSGILSTGMGNKYRGRYHCADIHSEQYRAVNSGMKKFPLPLLHHIAPRHPKVSLILFVSTLVWRTPHTNFPYVTSLNLTWGTPIIFTKYMVSVPFTLLPNPCANCPNSLAAEIFHVYLFIGSYPRCMYSSILPVSVARTKFANPVSASLWYISFFLLSIRPVPSPSWGVHFLLPFPLLISVKERFLLLSLLMLLLLVIIRRWNSYTCFNTHSTRGYFNPWGWSSCFLCHS